MEEDEEQEDSEQPWRRWRGTWLIQAALLEEVSPQTSVGMSLGEVREHMERMMMISLVRGRVRAAGEPA